MEGPGIDDIQPVQSPRLQQHENPAICSPAPGQHRAGVSPIQGTDVSIGTTLLFELHSSESYSRGSWPPPAPCSQSQGQEILSSAHHLSL